MNRNRLNQMRHLDRAHEGLHQVIQMNNGQGGGGGGSGGGGGGGGTGAQGQDQGKNSSQTATTQAQQLALRRKTMYTRTELLARGLPTTQTVRRSARKCPAAGQDWIPPLTPLSPKPRYSQTTKTAAAPAAPPPPPPAPMMNQNIQNSTNIPSPRKHRGSLLPRMAKRQPPKATERAAPMPSNIPQRMRVVESDHGKVEHHKAHLGHSQVHSRPQTPHTPHNHNHHTHLMNTPLGSESSSPVRRPGDRGGSNCSSDRRKIKLAKAIRLPDEQNKSFIYLCKPEKGKVKELLTPRKLRTSCDHLTAPTRGDLDADMEEEKGGKLRPSILEEALRSKAGHVDAANSGHYDIVPLMDMEEYSSSSASSQMNSPTIEALQQRQLELEDLEDQEQAANSQDHLRRQLKEVRNRQCQLRQLEKSQTPKNRPPDTDVVNQNLPALHHEIRLLQQLGEKLEATLRVTATTQRKAGGGLNGGEVGGAAVALPGVALTHLMVDAEPDKQSSSIFYTPRTGPIHFEELPITQVGYLRVEHNSVICQRARILGYSHTFGLVQEYRIETKTLNELKTADDSQCFYLPSLRDHPPHPMVKPVASALSIGGASGGPLQCTNFRKLRENPNVLLQQLRPLTHGHAQKPPPTFNLLDQDQMFFNSLAYVDPKAEAGLRASAQKLEREAGGGGTNYGGQLGVIAYSRLSVLPGVPHNSRYPQEAPQEELLRTKSSSMVVHSMTQTDASPEAKPDTVADAEANKEPETEVETQKSGSEKKTVKRAKRVKKTKEEPIKTKRRSNQMVTQPEPSNNHNNKNNDIKDNDNIKLKKKSSGSVVRATGGRQVAPESPIANGRNVEPKVRMQLLKTVLVGMVQVTVFLILIMAFTYPDIRC
ncbi:uncharacterized protein Dana_GF20955 [Drosophila ananassae]|uniref:Uncharacterized protein n=1 Tax=Drosophila ananassae TaxID=7217 RepID=B3MRQ3_DROAN|nr:uncharacterized protein LOC6503646 [Drosophila ananassae]EDV34458.1 uncharacterized protein Dana_GF20955 [Drosophila ananassae]